MACYQILFFTLPKTPIISNLIRPDNLFMDITGYHDGSPHNLHLEVNSMFGKSILALIVGEVSFVGSGANEFAALQEVRSQVEPLGWLLAVNGSRLDATFMPSKEVNLDLVTIITSSEKTNVKTLSPAPINKIGTLEEQAGMAPRLQELLAVDEKKKLRHKLQEEVQVTHVQGLRAKYGLFLSLFVVAYPFGAFIVSVLLNATLLKVVVGTNTAQSLINVAEANLQLILIEFSIGLILWALAVVQCVVELARSVSTTARIGLFICLTLPLIWSLIIGLVVFGNSLLS